MNYDFTTLRDHCKIKNVEKCATVCLYQDITLCICAFGSEIGVSMMLIKSVNQGKINKMSTFAKLVVVFSGRNSKPVI